MIPTLHIQLLGDFLLVSGDSPVTELSVPRLQSLLAYLVLHRNAPQARSHLAFLLWPDSTETQAHVNLRKALHHLRQALPYADQFLHADRQSLQWRASSAEAPWTLDIEQFEQALARSEQAEQALDMRAMRQALGQALALYRGDLLPGCYDEWILPERDHVRQSFFQAAERLIGLLEQERDYSAAIKIAQRLLHYDPLQEATYRSLMRFYALRGDRAAALRVYHICATVLERELGAEPSQATYQAYEALLQMDTSFFPRPTTSLSRDAQASLVGRKPEWAQLQKSWQRATSGHVHVVVISGEGGIGKTRLAEEMVAWVSRQGMATAAAHCYAAEGQLPYAPVTAWLRAESVQTGLPALADLWLTELARLVPDLLAKHPDLPRPSSTTEGWQRQHFFEALARGLLSARQPLLLLLDDLQWCDNETLQWLHYLFRFEPGARLLLIGTVRSEEISPEHPLLAFLGTLQRDGLVTEIPLRPLDTSEATALVEQIMGRQLDPAMSSALYRETEGNPLFIVEMARAGTLERYSTEQPVADNLLPLLTQPASPLPPTVQSVLSARLAQLSPLAREVANVAAVIGREFAFPVLAQASGKDEDAVVHGLDELWQRRIVREQGSGAVASYDFSHDKLRAQAYDLLGPSHRRLLHRRVAEAFENVSAAALDAVSGQIASHYELAGLPAQAIPYYQRAGQFALHTYANAEAIAAFQRAAALLEHGNGRQNVQWETVAQVYTTLGDILQVSRRHQEAREAFQRALQAVPPHEYIWQACLQRKIATTWQHFSDNPQDTFHVNARQAFQEAERILTQAPDRSSELWLQEWIQLQLDQLFPLRASVDEMTAIIEKAQPIVKRHGTAEQRGQFFLAATVRDMERDRYVVSEQTVSSYREALAATLQTGNRASIGFMHFALGNSLLWTGHLDEAEEHIHHAMHIGEQIGHAILLTRCLTFLPFIYRLRGEVEKVRSIITRALAVSEAKHNSIITGHRAWLAWRDGNLAEAERYGRESLEDRQERQRVKSFYWAGAWPLIGVALAQGKDDEAICYVRLLLDPTQQPPPEQLRELLEAALQAWDTGQQQEAHALLRQAAPLAEARGYL